jgi:carbon monoxide dehydrogenase subunit G
MKFSDSFEVPVNVATTWEALTDIERVYPCLPGAELTGLEDGAFHGLVTLKLGPITASYKGSAFFESLDEENRKLVIRAEGRDRHGQGSARARIEASLQEDGADGTKVVMANEVDITGKAAQFGRGIITDVSKEIMGQFAANLRETLVSPPGEAADSGASAGGGGPAAPAEPAASAQPIGVASLAGKVIMNRLRDPRVMAGLAAGLAILVLARRRRR